MDWFLYIPFLLYWSTHGTLFNMFPTHTHPCKHIFLRLNAFYLPHCDEHIWTNCVFSMLPKEFGMQAVAAREAPIFQ